MSLAERLKVLGLVLPEVAKPVASYIPARSSVGQIYTSGQLPLKDGQLLHSGPLQREDQVAAAALAAEQCFLNALAAALQLEGALAGVVKLTVFVASGPEFVWQHLVANGASNLAQKIFAEGGQHARSAVGVSSLPLNASVEVEAIFAAQN